MNATSSDRQPPIPMLAMQYSFALPADYDMAIIQERIATKGYLMDDYPLLALKAYLFACRNEAPYRSEENLYAPFYLWKDTAGMNSFLGSEGFQGLVQAFGWPTVKIWSVWLASFGSSLAKAAFATREIASIPPHTRLAQLQQQEETSAREAMEAAGALGAWVAFEPTTWTLVRFRLWESCHAAWDQLDGQVYRVGHLSIPECYLR